MPNYSVYECADGKHLAVGSLEAKFFQETMRQCERPDLLKKPLTPGASPLREELAALFKTRTRDEWEAKLAHLDTCVSSVLTPDEALANEQVLARGLVETLNGKPVIGLPIQFSDAKATRGPAPKLGADNAVVLGPLRQAAVAS